MRPSQLALSPCASRSVLGGRSARILPLLLRRELLQGAELGRCRGPHRRRLNCLDMFLQDFRGPCLRLAVFRRRDDERRDRLGVGKRSEKIHPVSPGRLTRSGGGRRGPGPHCRRGGVGWGLFSWRPVDFLPVRLLCRRGRTRS